MSKFRFILLAIFIFFILSSITVISATDLNESLPYSDDSLNSIVGNDLIEENHFAESKFENRGYEGLSEGNWTEIYVGQSTEGVGDGSYENPFSSVELACNNISGEQKVSINIFNGTYEIKSLLNINSSNIIVQGINGSVILDYSNKEKNSHSFVLENDFSNITFNNIIFNAKDLGYTSYFILTKSSNNTYVFNDCTFIFPRLKVWMNEYPGSSNQFKFYNCLFESISTRTIPIFSSNSLNREILNIHFDYCIFNLPKVRYLCSLIVNETTDELINDISINNSWFFSNSFLGCLSVPPMGYYSGNTLPDRVFPVNRYAIFSVSQNYLGNNQYEILGKLTWNGTEDQDGMENFKPMDVTLKSTTGDINQTATLVNGTFRAIYTSSAVNHKVTATLDNEGIDLEFTTVNITSYPVMIYYSEDQNITFNFTQPITANVTVTVSNGSYNKTEKVEIIDKDSITYTVLDTLKEGTYDVEINLAENNLFGFNTTTLTVSKVSEYTFDVLAGDVKVGENATISITLPEDVNGTVIVKFGNDTKELSANQTMTVNFTNLNATTYNVNVSYSGNDKYVALDKPASVTVNKADSVLEIENAAFTYGDVITIPFNVTNANGVTVSVLNKDDDEVATASSESGTINLDTLPVGKYTLEATTIVSSNYEWVSKTIGLTINKANSSLNIQDKEFAYAEDAVINAVTENSTGDVIATLTDENNTEITVTVSGDSITLPKLNTGKYTLTVTTNPDENHNDVTKTATIKINKATPSMNVIVEPVENITTKDNVTLTIRLPSDATGEVTVKINGKKTEIKSVNETITLDLNNQAGDYVVDVTYSGDKNYESDMATQEYTVSKAETSITAKQIDFEEGNTSKIEVTLLDVESGIVLVDVAGKKFYGDIDSGKATITLQGVSEGNYTANVKFFGDDKYKEATTIADIKVSEAKIITELKEQLEEAQDNATQLFNNLTDANNKIENLTTLLNESQANATKLAEDLADANQTIEDLLKQLDEAKTNATNSTVPETVVIDGVEYPIEYVNGIATVETNKTEPVVVKSSEFGEITISDDQFISIVLKDSEGNVIADAPITYTVNGAAQSTTTDKDGKFTVKGENDAVITINYAGNDNITSTNTTLKLNNAVVPEVVKVAAQFNISDRAITLNGYAVDGPAGEQGIYYTTTLLDTNGKPISNAYIEFAVNNKIYNRTTLENGSFNPYKLNMVRAGRYTMAFNFAGDGNYTNAFACVCVDLDKKPITIKAPAKTYKAAAKTKKYTATLSTIPSVYDGKVYLSPQTVKLTVNGKTFTGKTNDKGQVTFKITNLNKKGKYAATISYKGDKTYEEATQKVKLTIK